MAIRSLLIIALCLVLAACGGIPVAGRVPPEQRAALLEGRSLRPDGTPLVLPDDTVMSLSPEMARFAEQAVDGIHSERARIRALTAALISPALLGINYDAGATLTAEQTFRTARANCLSFTTLLVLMARHVGLEARFNEVDVPPIWDMQSEETLVLYRHVNALLKTDRGGRQVVDLDTEQYDTSFRQRAISDRLAIAQYFNNRAMEYLFDGQIAEAHRYLAKAVEVDGHASYFWSNLGAVYERAGDRVAAEQAYRIALEIDPGDLVAMGNAARLYAAMGRSELAAELEARTQRYRMRNPYYRYRLGVRAYLAGDFESARREAQAAVGMHRQEHRFHFLLGVAYRELGDLERARASFDEAVTLTSDDRQIRRYRHKVDMLMSARL